MISVPAQMQPTLDRWKQTQSLGEGMKFGANGGPAQYEQLMDQVVLLDNQSNDAAPEPGLVVCKDDNETLKFQGDSKQGSLEAACADGPLEAQLQVFLKDVIVGFERSDLRVTAINYNEKPVNFLQLTNEPGASEAIFAQKASAPAPTVSPEHAAKAQVISQGLATMLNVAPDAVKVSEFSTQKGFNASNCDFAVSGEMQMSAWTQGIESKFECDGQKYVYRGLDEKTGRYGQDVAHQGYWKQDERGIFVPDLNAPKEDIW